MGFNKQLQVANIQWLEKKLESIYSNSSYCETSFLDRLLLDRITWHCGGMSDPFQPIEEELNVTKNMIDVTNKYDINILFSTKSDTVYKSNIRPDLHTFQLSVTNISNRTDIEPNVPPIEKRLDMFNQLKKDGFRVGIRMQPFIPGVTTVGVVDMFNQADYFTIEGLKLVPQNKEHRQEILKMLNVNKDDFKQMGLLNLKPEVRCEIYKPIIKRLNDLKIPFSIADNDMHYISSGKCCCGDVLVKRSTEFNNTSIMFDKGRDYCLSCVNEKIGNYKDCKADMLFTSNRTEGCKTVQDFFIKRFDRKSSPFSPLFQYDNDKLQGGAQC